jgi:hypothetical protein
MRRSFQSWPASEVRFRRASDLAKGIAIFVYMV